MAKQSKPQKLKTKGPKPLPRQGFSTLNHSIINACLSLSLQLYFFLLDCVVLETSCHLFLYHLFNSTFTKFSEERKNILY